MPPSAEEIEILVAMRRMIADSILYSHQVAEKVGLGPSDSQFMTLLEVHGPMTPGQLAQRSGLTTGTVTGVIDRLERLGLVDRTRSPRDRRSVVVSRNEEAIRKLMEPHYGSVGEGFLELMRKYTPEQKALILEFLNQLR